MYIYIDFYKQFHCIGSDCQNSCCSEWGIAFDPASADYYQNLDGEFGDFVRQNISWNESQKLAFVNLTPERKCPFLDEHGLCRIYIECGEDRMSDGCKVFPRTKLNHNGNSMRGFTLSCEEVLRILYIKPDPVHLCAEGSTDIETMDDLMIFELAQFIGWGMELLQDETIPFSVALATVLSVGLEAEISFKNQDYEAFESTILQADELQKQFTQAREELTSEMKEFAWNLIFGITDSFCLIVRDSNAYDMDAFLWPYHIFGKDDIQRRNFLLECWNKRKDTPEQMRFLRRLAAAFFQTHSMALGSKPATSLYLQDMCNYLILARVLPLTWENCPRAGEQAYFSRLNYIAHHFEQSSIMREFIWPVIQDLFSPDLYSYAMAFMVLFENL